MLIEGSWLPENRIALEALIRRYGKQGDEYDAARAPFAVFDWDQTIIRHDIGDALFVHQMEQLAFAVDHDHFWQMLADAGDVATLRAGIAALREVPRDE